MEDLKMLFTFLLICLSAILLFCAVYSLCYLYDFYFNKTSYYDGKIDKIEEMDKIELKKHLSKTIETRTKTYYYWFKEDAIEFVENYTRDFIEFFGYELVEVKYTYDVKTVWDYDTKRIPVFNGCCISYITHRYNYRNKRSYKKEKVIITYKTVPNYTKYFDVFGQLKCELPFQK